MHYEVTPAFEKAYSWVASLEGRSFVLTRLDTAESDLYRDLVADSLAERIRLEQERIDWSWAEAEHRPSLS